MITDETTKTRRLFARLGCVLLLALVPPIHGASTQPPLVGTPVAPDSYEAQLVAAFPKYVPEQSVSGVIRIWGHGKRTLPWMQHLVG